MGLLSHRGTGAAGRVSTLFERLFTSEQVAALTASSALTPKQAERLSGWAGGRNLTGQGRVEKLLMILERIGVTSLMTVGGNVAITAALLESLIRQRNKAALCGANIDVHAVHTVLFALAREALAYMATGDDLREASQRTN